MSENFKKGNYLTPSKIKDCGEKYFSNLKFNNYLIILNINMKKGMCSS